MLAQRPFDGAEQLDAGSLFPMAAAGSLVAVGNGIIFIEAAEVVDAGDVVKAEAIVHAADPPLIAGGAVLLPAVEGIAPQLAVFGEGVRRAACHGDGNVFSVQLEQLRMRPCVRAVHGDVNRDIADDLHAVFVGVVL